MFRETGSGEEATYERVQSSEIKDDQKSPALYRVWEVFDKADRHESILCEGYCDYIVEPAAPKLEVEGFWRLFVLSFNPIEHEEELFPPSDVYDLRHPQMEYNQSRQALREHRVANRPLYATEKGKLDESDKDVLQSRPANGVVELNALLGGQKIDDVLQAVKPVPIDFALYDTGPVLEDVLRSVGEQEARIGGTSGATATETTVAEGARRDSLASNVDDVDECLTSIARATGQVMFAHLGQETVIEIVGPGAVWPELDREQIAKEVLLSVKSGSTGRPNKASELANRERAMPFLIQMPGLNPTPIAKDYLELLDIDVEQAIVEGLPSIIALNAAAGRAAQPASADPGADPSAQGGQGGNNAPAAQQRQPGSQPAFPGRPGQNPRGNLP